MSKWERKIGTSDDANCICIIGKSLEVENIYKSYGRQGVGIALYQYNLEDLLNCLLDDYGAETIIQKINEINQ